MTETVTHKSTTRKSCTPIKVYCLPEEKALIEAQAKASGKSLSSYLLTVGQGYEVRGIVDYEQVKQLALINGDLGRLGGLLKLWLTNDERTAHFCPKTIYALLTKIENTQNEMSKMMMSVLLPKRGK